MLIDTGKASISFYHDQQGHIDHDTVVVDIYSNDNLSDKDIAAIHHGIKEIGADLPVDTICIKSGLNSLSDSGFIYSLQHNCIHNRVVFVIKHMQDIHLPSEAEASYFKEHLVDYSASVEEAYQLLHK